MSDAYYGEEIGSVPQRNTAGKIGLVLSSIGFGGWLLVWLTGFLFFASDAGKSGWDGLAQILGFLLIGCLFSFVALIGTIVCLVGLRNQPRGMAIAGLILGLLAWVPLVIGILWIAVVG